MHSGSGTEGGLQGQPVAQKLHLAADDQPLWKRLVWMAAIWLGSVAVLGAVAYGIRVWLKP